MIRQSATKYCTYVVRSLFGIESFVFYYGFCVFDFGASYLARHFTSPSITSLRAFDVLRCDRQQGTCPSFHFLALVTLGNDVCVCLCLSVCVCVCVSVCVAYNALLRVLS